MLVKVKFYKSKANAYGGREYIYIAGMPVRCGDVVMAPTNDGEQKAIITDINVPHSEVNPAWADNIKTITRFDDSLRSEEPV